MLITYFEKTKNGLAITRSKTVPGIIKTLEYGPTKMTGLFIYDQLNRLRDSIVIPSGGKIEIE